MKKWIQTQNDKFDHNDMMRKYDQIIVLTHHAPSFAMLNKSDLYSLCYATDCDNMMVSPIKYWISGHTHISKRVEINGTICISNCMGYPGQNVEGFSTDRYIIFP